MSILIVLLSHSVLVWGAPTDSLLYKLTAHGDLGVRVFFVISGFLITTILLGELQRSGRIDLPRFYFRRTLRILPACYVYIGVVVVLESLRLLVAARPTPLVNALPALFYL